MSANAIGKPKTRPMIFSLLTLLSGIVIGVGATLIFVGPKENDTSPPLPEEFSRRMVQHLTQELALTPEQQENIRPVVEAHMEVLDGIREEARPKIRQELEQMNNEILALLDENQKQLWKDSIERMQRRFREFRQRRGPGDDQRRRDGNLRDRDKQRLGDDPEGDPNSPPMRRWRSRDEMSPGMMPPPDWEEPPDLPSPQDPNQPSKEV